MKEFGANFTKCVHNSTLKLYTTLWKENKEDLEVLVLDLDWKTQCYQDGNNTQIDRKNQNYIRHFCCCWHADFNFILKLRRPGKA